VIQKNKYDVIIIGAGISGLICGCYLAKAGMKVLIVEQHNKPGGYCTSFKRNGFTFDAAAHSLGSYREGGNFRKIITELGIDKLIKIKRFDPSDIVITPDFKILFYNDVTKTIYDLANIFPAEKENIIRYYNFVTNLDQFETVKLKNKTFANLLELFFNDNRLINSLFVPVLGNGGLPPSLMHAFTGSKIFAEFLIDGGYSPEGGIQSLPNALEHILIQNKGNFLYKRIVKKILVKNNAVTGVKLDNNETIISKYVISACDMIQTFKTFLGANVIGNQMISKLKNMIPSISTFILYLGIDKPFKGLPPPGTNIWYISYYDLEKIFYYMNLCDFNKAGGYMLRLSPDKKTILGFSFAPFKTRSFWKQHKQRIAQDFLKKIEKIIPDLKKHIVYFDAATPYTLYRYTFNYRGANYGWAPLQSQLFDPDFRQKSFIKGLYLTGHWTTQTHGIPGVSYLGYNTAKLILKREKIKLI
jgi:phytoene dehydrogenase-like protein